MKKGTKIAMILCSVLLVAGAVLALMGVSMGAKLSYDNNDLENVLENTAFYRIIDYID